MQTATSLPAGTRLPAELLCGAGVWDVKRVHGLLQSQGRQESRRTVERLLHRWGFWPEALGPLSLRDEQGRPCHGNVLQAVLQQARRERRRVLFVQSHVMPDGRRWVHANDARGGRYWVQLDAAGADPSATVWSTLTQLRLHLGNDLLALAHGALVTHWRNGPAFDGVDLAPQVYPVVLPSMAALRAQTGSQPNAMSPHLRRLESESIHILREAVAEAQNPVMLYSIGKDSGVMLHLARKAFYPASPPFPLLHVDTRWKFQEMYAFRDRMAADCGMELLVHTNPQAIERDINPFDHGSALHTDITKTEGLKQALDQHRFDVVLGGARRDEEKSRAKERVFSLRSPSHRWEPKQQRPELWNLYNTRKRAGASLRVFPLSNWTELDIWQYVLAEGIPVVPLYFAKKRPVVVRPDMVMMVDDDRCQLLPGEKIEMREVRFRTLGCYPLTGAIESTAATVQDILAELVATRDSERQGRKIDTDSSGSMEKKKQEGYF